MKLRKSLCVTIVAVAVFVVAGAAAKPNGSKHVVVAHDAMVAGSHLAHGEYNIQWQTHSPQGKVSFVQRGKVVATAEGKVVDRGTKYPFNEIVYSEAGSGAPAIQEIRFRGSSEVIVFGE